MIEETLTTAHRHQSQMLSLYQNPLRSSSKTAQRRHQAQLLLALHLQPRARRLTENRWSKEEEELLVQLWASVLCCSQILFSSATVAFRTNFLSLADFK